MVYRDFWCIDVANDKTNNIYIIKISLLAFIPYVDMVKRILVIIMIIIVIRGFSIYF